jgi:mannose-6-phosphate isomerase-like protein (cupin superfamily)
MIPALEMPFPAQLQTEHLTIYSLVPPEAGQGWKLEMFELSEPIATHYHKVQRQCILVADGELIAFYGEDHPVVLKCGQIAVVDPGKLHALTPIGKARFFSLDMPGFNYPEDVYFDVLPPPACTWTPINSDFFPYIDSKYFGSKIPRPENYWVYDLIPGSAAEERWSLALIEIHDSPKHFHRIESEQFIVVNGILDIEIDGVRRIVHVGESVETKPGMVHQLKSANAHPVRVLCFSYPAFDPSDKNYVD